MARSVHVYVNNCWGRTIDQRCTYGVSRVYRLNNLLWKDAGILHFSISDGVTQDVKLDHPDFAVYSNGEVKWKGEKIKNDNKSLREAVLGHIRIMKLTVEPMYARNKNKEVKL